MAERFYTNSPLGPGSLVLDGPEAHHLAVVCRVRPDDLVCLFNGDGLDYPARVLSAHKRAVSLEVSPGVRVDRELAFTLEVAAPPPKGDRAQFLVEKLTEIGVTSYVPLSCRRSVISPGEAKLEKLARYVVEASKQCRRNVLMRVGPVTPWEEYCRRPPPDARKVLAHPGGAERFGPGPGHRAVYVAVGPEGGFTDEEAALGREHGWELTSLGPRILRVETAALVLAAWAVAAAPPES